MNILSKNENGFAFINQSGPLPTHEVDFYFGEDFAGLNNRQSEELCKRLVSLKLNDFVIGGLKFTPQVNGGYRFVVKHGQLAELEFDTLEFITQLSAPHALKFPKNIKKTAGEWR